MPCWPTVTESWYIFTMRKLSPPDETHQKSDGGQPRSSDRALHLLKFVGRSDTGTSLTDAAADAELPISTALRQLRSLEAAGLVRRDVNTQMFFPGVELVRLAFAVISAAPLPTLTQPHLDSLAAATHESCYLAIPRDTKHAVYVASTPGTHQLRHTGWLDRPLPHRGTAVGAALAARRVEAFTQRDGIEEGVTAISCPIFDANDHVVAAVSVVGPSFRFTPAFVRTCSKHCIAAAKDISHAIGHQGVA